MDGHKRSFCGRKNRPAKQRFFRLSEDLCPHGQKQSSNFFWQGRGVAYIATELSQFIQYVAVSMVGRGYFFYVLGEIPAGKDPLAVDEKLGDRYAVTRSKTKRNRRKRAGLANVLYARLGRFFVIAATHGETPFFEEEAKRLRDARETPIKFAGYSIGYRRGQGTWHPSVRIELEKYRELKAHFLEIAPHRSPESIAAEFRRRVDYEPYAPIRAQLFSILRAVNRARKAAGREPVEGVPFRLVRSRCGSSSRSSKPHRAEQ